MIIETLQLELPTPVCGTPSSPDHDGSAREELSLEREMGESTGGRMTHLQAACFPQNCEAPGDRHSGSILETMWPQAH